MSNLIKRYQQNTVGKDWVVGDIHGHFTRLLSALGAIDFDPTKDRLFSTGDLVDRGPESHLAMEWIDKPWFFPVRGNHEDFAIRWAQPDNNISTSNYAYNGGQWNIDNNQSERIAVANKLSTLPVAIELETANGLIGIIHAEPTDDWNKLRDMLQHADEVDGGLDELLKFVMWDRSRIQSNDDCGVVGVAAAVVGHTPIIQTITLGNVHYIDTGGWHPKGAGFSFFDTTSMWINTVSNPDEY